MTDSGDSALLKFLILAKTVKGKSLVGVIQQALQNPSTFVFGELLEHPNVRAVQPPPFIQSTKRGK